MNTRLAELRKRAGLTQKELGEKLGVSDSMISGWESGAKTISIKHKEQMEELFGDVSGLDFYPPNQMAKCVICGRMFTPVSTNSVTMTCSTECKTIWLTEQRFGRSSHAPTAEMLEQLRGRFKGNPRLGNDAFMDKPGSQAGSDNRNSKTWLLVDPDGNVHEVTGLRSWCRENAALFGKEPDEYIKIANGFTAIANSMRGRRKKKCESYFGWTLAALPAFQGVTTNLSTLPYPAFLRLRTASLDFENTDEDMILFADDQGIDPTPETLQKLRLIRESAESTMEALFAISGLSADDFSNRYSLPIRSVRAWSEGTSNISAWAMKMLSYVVVMDRLEQDKGKEQA